MSTSEEQKKYRNWVFTWNDSDDGLVNEEDLQYFLEQNMDVYVFQLEKGENEGRKHYQGCFKTKIRQRKRTVLQSFDELDASLLQFQNLTIKKMEGSWDQAFTYCTKESTRAGDSYLCSHILKKYEGADINFLDEELNRFPWQVDLLKEIAQGTSYNLSPAKDRKIIWITDGKGCCGKSKFIKYMCYNYNSVIKLPFGTAAQIRSAVISAGPQNAYFIDIPKTLGEDDSMNSIISACEDIKNGHVVSSMYGKYEHMLFAPPHVIVLSNERCPKHLMSEDRWETYVIDPIDKTWISGEYVCG